MAPVDIQERIARGPTTRAEELRLELFEKVNALGIGAQGLGGLTTVVDVKVLDYPTHAANLPVAIIPNCAATRHVHFHLDGSGPAELPTPKLEDWPQVTWKANLETSKRVNLDTLTKEEVASWKPGQTLLLNGKMLTGRDAAHTRMDKFTETMLAQTGLITMIGKSERGPTAIESIKKHGSAYLMAVGGAAYLVAKAIRAAKVVGFEDLGMEAIYEFEVQDMPVTVAVDSKGESVHETGPKIWQAKIGKIPVAVA
jgi:fumarate hydratase class I